MSLPRPSGMKAPTGSKLARPGSGVPQKSGLLPPGTLSRTQSEESLTGPPAPADDFIIGDRVYVSGSKPGYIAFLGETQFAPGEWAGVVLDELIGKNDGSVNGVRYFQCEAKRGVFCRISKLSRTPGISEMSNRGDDAMSEVSIPMNGENNNIPSKRPTTPSSLHRPTTPSHESRLQRPSTPSHDSRMQRPTTPGLHRSINKSLSSSNTSLNKGAAPAKARTESVTSTPGASTGVKHNLSLGDRVLVSGSKPGTLRYIGPADFAKGQWAGVELDDALGKNDGAVAGKRYFDCRPKYGLFAPVHKVTKMSSGQTPSPMTRSLGSTSLRLSREKSGSQESVSSISSATSSASRPRVRLGVSGLGNSQTGNAEKTAGRTGQRPSTLNISATTSALQKALKEKEEHIEQLLRERDLERSEVARAAAHVEEYQDQLSQLRTEKERFQDEHDETLQQLKAHLKKVLQEKNDLEEKLEDEKRKVEDLQFQIEEEVISKDDLESVKSRTEEEEAKIRELEKCLKKEKERSEKFDVELATLKATTERQRQQLESMEETQTSYLDQIEELTHKLSQAEMKIQAHDSSRVEEGAKTSQVGLELAEKTARVSELEDFLSLRDKEVKQLQDRLAEMKDDLDNSILKQERSQQSLEELTEKLKTTEVFSNDLSIQVQNLKSQNSELQRQLGDSQERTKQLSEEKLQLDQRIEEMMKNSGDSSNQLSLLNDRLGQKTRKLEELQADLSTSTQKWHSLNNEFEAAMREKTREMEMLTAQHQETQKTLNSQLEDVQRDLEKSRNKIIAMEAEFETEKENLVKRKDSEIGDLRQQLDMAAENVSKQEIQTQAHKQVLDTITMEKDAIQFEKEKLEKQLKRLEADKDTLNNELIQLKVSMATTETSQGDLVKQKTALEEEVQELKTEKQRLEELQAELQKSKDEVQADKEKVTGERDRLQTEAMENRASLQQKEMLVEELQKELERLKTENTQQQTTINQLSEQTADSGALQKQMAEQMSLVEALQKQLKETKLVTSQKSQEHEESLRSLKIEVEEAQETVGLLEENVKELEMERDSLKSQLQTALDARQEHAKLMELNQTLNEEIETVTQRFRKEVESLTSAKDQLQKEVDNSTALLQQKEDVVKAKLAQISNLENDNSMLMSYKSSNEKLEKEAADLRDTINTLQAKVANTENNANVITNMDSTGSNDVVEKLKEENEATQHQVEFLNSVIVDLQHKNEELKLRLEVMEQGLHNGADDSMEVRSPTRRAAPRVFCDICDVFDQHETEDCPLQEMSDSPPPSQYHGDRKQVRPYCDICEAFGHSTEQCDDEQTF